MSSVPEEDRDALIARLAADPDDDDARADLLGIHLDLWSERRRPEDLEAAITHTRLLSRGVGGLPDDLILLGLLLAERNELRESRDDRIEAVGELGKGLRASEPGGEFWLEGSLRYGFLAFDLFFEEQDRSYLDSGIAVLAEAREHSRDGADVETYETIRSMLCEMAMTRAEIEPTAEDARLVAGAAGELLGSADPVLRAQAHAVAGLSMVTIGQLRSGDLPMADLHRIRDLFTVAEAELPETSPLRPRVMIGLGGILSDMGSLTRDGSALLKAVDLLERAVRTIAPDDPYAHNAAGTYGATLAAAAWVGALPEDAYDRAVEVLEPVRDLYTGTARLEMAISLAMAYGAMATTRGDLAMLERSIAEMRLAEGMTVPGTPDHGRILFNHANSLIIRFSFAGEMRDLDLAEDLLDRARPTAGDSMRVSDAGIQGVQTSVRGFRCWKLMDWAGVDQATAELTRVLSVISPADPIRPVLNDHLQTLRAGSSMRAGGPAEWVRLFPEGSPAEGGTRTFGALTEFRNAVGKLIRVTSRYDAALVDEAIAQLRAGADGDATPEIRRRFRAMLGSAYTLRASHGGGTPDHTRAIDSYERVAAELGDSPGHPVAPVTRAALSHAYRTRGLRGDEAESLRNGEAALREYARAVLLQTGADHALAAARAASTEAIDLALWLLGRQAPVDALRILEMGRGLVLHASTSSADVPGLLRAAGRPDLAEAWTSTDRKEEDLLPAALRGQTVRVLTAPGAAGAQLLDPPDPREIGDALSRADADALVYLVPGGTALWVSSTGTVSVQPLELLKTGDGDPLTAFASADPEEEEWLDALQELCAWAGRAAMEEIVDRARRLRPDRDPRLVLVPTAALGQVPWHAAVLASGRHAVEEVTIHYAASARQFVSASRRRHVPYRDGPVIVADTRLEAAAYQVETFKSFYPNAIALVDADADPAAVLARLPGPHGAGAPIVELACHGEIVPADPVKSRLILPSGELRIVEILSQTDARAAGTAGGVVLATACVSGVSGGVHEEALSVASSFLAAGSTAAVGTLWEVPDQATAPFMYCFHHHVSRGLRPADALREAQRWALDPDRPRLKGMPVELDAAMTEETDLSLLCWAAFALHGV